MRWVLPLLVVFPIVAFAQQAKSPVPGAAELKEAKELIRDVYKDDFAKATSPKGKVELANKLLNEAIQTNDDPTGRFVLLNEARQVAAEAVDPSLAMKAVELIAGHFEIDFRQLQIESLASIAENANFSTQYRITAKAGLKVLKQLIDELDFARAKPTLEIIVTAAKKANDSDLWQEAQRRQQDFDAISKAFSDARPAIEKLKTNDSLDAEANLTVGKFYCFHVRNWEKGIPMLARGGDKLYSEVAAMELEAPKAHQEQVKIGDLWYKVAESQTGAVRRAVQERAAQWYSTALPKLTGLTAAKIRKRLNTLPKAATPFNSKTTPSIVKTSPQTTNPPPTIPAKSDAERQVAIALGLKWLADQQQPNGSWSYATVPNGGTNKSGVAATAMGLLCFLRAGHTTKQGAYKANVTKGLQFLGTRMKSNGDLRDPGSNLYVQGLATLALCECYARTKDRRVKQAAQAAIQFVVYCQDPKGGGWRYQPKQTGDTSVTGWHVSALRIASRASIPVPSHTIRGAAFFLDSVSNEDGSGYGYTRPGDKLTTSAIGLYCRLVLGTKPTVPGIKKGIDTLASTGPSRNNIYHNYYASLAIRNSGSAHWGNWYKSINTQLLPAQSTDGPTAGSWPPLGGLIGKECGRMGTTAMCVMVLLVGS
ncbi:MAG: prenyltransferase/squalene oxidase repeat-containing protein [Planctomycetaceae bacterium]